MLVMVTDTVQKLYSIVLATWALSEILSGKDKAFYFFMSLILTNVKVKVNMMLLYMNVNINRP